MERVWNAIDIRYCPVVGHNVVVEPGRGEDRKSFVCQRADRCRAERGGCRHPAAGENPLDSTGVLG